jgi:predicted GIY-YIG superfamily endonuclease
MQVSVYILQCSDGSYYTGITQKPVEARVWEHNARVVEGYTSTRLPVTLMCVEVFDRIDEAIVRERQIKGWNRLKKEALIAGAYEALPALARGRATE